MFPLCHLCTWEQRVLHDTLIQRKLFQLILNFSLFLMNNLLWESLMRLLTSLTISIHQCLMLSLHMYSKKLVSIILKRILTLAYKILFWRSFDWKSSCFTTSISYLSSWAKFFFVRVIYFSYWIDFALLSLIRNSCFLMKLRSFSSYSAALAKTFLTS